MTTLSDAKRFRVTLNGPAFILQGLRARLKKQNRRSSQDAGESHRISPRSCTNASGTSLHGPDDVHRGAKVYLQKNKPRRRCGELYGGDGGLSTMRSLGDPGDRFWRCIANATPPSDALRAPSSPKGGRAAVALLRRSCLAWQTRGASGLRRAVNPNAPGAQPQSSAPKGGGGGEAQRSRRRGSIAG